MPKLIEWQCLGVSVTHISRGNSASARSEPFTHVGTGFSLVAKHLEFRESFVKLSPLDLISKSLRMTEARTHSQTFEDMTPQSPFMVPIAQTDHQKVHLSPKSNSAPNTLGPQLGKLRIGYKSDEIKSTE
nr:hypothetical protein [uncultured Celeribacter sp.]